MGVIIGVPYHWLLFWALKGTSKATVLNVTPVAGHLTKISSIDTFAAPFRAFSNNALVRAISYNNVFTSLESDYNK